MKVSIRKVSNHALVVRLHGIMDAAQTHVVNLGLDHAQWEAQLISGPLTVVVDLGEVSFLDSSGLKVLARGLQPAFIRPAHVRLVWPRSRHVCQVLKLVGFDQHYHFVSDLNQAIENLPPPN